MSGPNNDYDPVEVTPLKAEEVDAQREAALPQVPYGAIFEDSRLRSLIAQALENNRDVRIAAANIAAARAQVAVERGGRFPPVPQAAEAAPQSARRYPLAACKGRTGPP